MKMRFQAQRQLLIIQINENKEVSFTNFFFLVFFGVKFCLILFTKFNLKYIIKINNFWEVKE